MLQLESIEGAYSFHSYDEQSIKLIKPKHTIHNHHNIEDDLIELRSSVLIYKDCLISKNWPVSFSQFDQACIKQLTDTDADIFLIATGSYCQFPEKECLQYIADQKLAIDFMDIGAAARTFNILSSEYRKVAALIFFS